MAVKFEIDELEELSFGSTDDWKVVAVNHKGERRWDYDEEIVFTSEDGNSPFYAFTYYVGVGDSEIDFEPSEVYQVIPVEVKTTKWVKAGSDSASW